MPILYSVTPSSCAQPQDCGTGQPCVPQPGECVYYSGTFLSGSNIQEGDNFNTVTIKLNNYIGTLINNFGTITGGTNLGTGARVYESTANPNLRFRTLVAGTNIVMTETPTEIVIATSGVGSQYSAINVGFQAEVFKIQAGNEFQFRTLMGEDLISTDIIGDNIVVRYNNKDRFNSTSDTTRFYPLGTYIEKIVVFPQATLSSFRVGTTPGADDIVLEQPIANRYTTVLVEKYLSADTTLYIEGINSYTQFVVFLEKF